MASLIHLCSQRPIDYISLLILPFFLSLSLKWLATVAVCLAACSKWRHYDDLIFIFASENDAKTSKNSLDIDSVWLTFAVICILLMLSLMSIACRYVISIFFRFGLIIELYYSTRISFFLSVSLFPNNRRHHCSHSLGSSYINIYSQYIIEILTTIVIFNWVAKFVLARKKRRRKNVNCEKKSIENDIVKCQLTKNWFRLDTCEWISILNSLFNH